MKILLIVLNVLGNHRNANEDYSLESLKLIIIITFIYYLDGQHKCEPKYIKSAASLVASKFGFGFF